MSRTKISKARRQMVFCRDGYMCVYCWKQPTSFGIEHCNKPFRINIIPYDENHREFEVDHFIPYVKTQDNSFTNLVTSCLECNNKKSNRKWNKPHIRKMPI